MGDARPLKAHSLQSESLSYQKQTEATSTGQKVNCSALLYIVLFNLQCDCSNPH